MTDLLFLTHNRREFTQACLSALLVNTDWSKVDRLILYDDDSQDGALQYLESVNYPIEPVFRFSKYGSPVTIMNDYLCSIDPAEPRLFAKIDSDTMVPAGWLDACLQVMKDHPQLDLLGIEAMNDVKDGPVERSFSEARYIGGIGLMRTACFVTLPRPNGRFGFTAWQDKSERVVKGWINPSLPVFLLDRLPREPWVSLSKEYVANGWQRPWGLYEEKNSPLWQWWCE